jgi:hypothetical protein
VWNTILFMVIILAVGNHLTDGVRLRQEEIILGKLPLPEARAYYDVLRARVRRVRLLRAITLLSVLLALLAARRRFFPPPPRTPVPATAPRPTNTDAARALAEAELGRYAARIGADPGSFTFLDVRGDEHYPWIFEYRSRAGRDRVHVYVARDGKAEVAPVTGGPTP